MSSRIGTALRRTVATTSTRPLSTAHVLRASFESDLAAAASPSPSSSSSSRPRPAPTPRATGSHAGSIDYIPVPSRPPPPPSSEPTPDAALLSTLARLIMKSGKLARAHSHLSLCLSTIALSTSSQPMPVLTRALEIASPSIRIVGRRKGTKSLPTPQPLTAEQRTRQAWKWIVEASDKRQSTEKLFGKRLAAEVLAVLGGQSEAIKKKEAKHLQGVTGRANVGR